MSRITKSNEARYSKSVYRYTDKRRGAHEVEIWIDEDWILKQLAPRAIDNRSKVATAIAQGVVVKVRT